MFKKLSPALVAISLVAVAQPALAQDATHNMIVGSTTENSVTGQAGPIWTYAPGNRKVTVEGQRTLRKGHWLANPQQQPKGIRGCSCVMTTKKT